MTDVTHILNQFREIESFVMTTPDGDVVASDVNNPGEIASLVTLCGIGSEQIMESSGFARFNHLVLSRIENRNFLILPAGNNYLGIQQVSGTDSAELARQLTAALAAPDSQIPTSADTF